SGSFTTTADATLTVQADGFFSNALLTVSQGFTNFGLIELTCVNAATQARLDVTSGTLVNAGGGTIPSSVAAGGGRQLNAAPANQGTLKVEQALNMGAALLNLNAGTLTGGTYNIQSSWSFADAAIVVNAATLILDGPASAILDLASNNALANFASISAGGSL